MRTEKNNLLIKRNQPNQQGCIQSITPKTVSWQYVGFSVFELDIGQVLTLPAIAEETCLVLIAGKASVITKRKANIEQTTPNACTTDHFENTDHFANTYHFENIGERMSPFEKLKPYAVYVAPNQSITINANTHLEFAVCTAPANGKYPTRLITPDKIGAEQRGKGQNQRFVQNILPETEPAESLLVVEVFTEEGCTSSYPSHKHDTDNPPYETYLEETYYHRLDPEQGFCLQRVYTDDRQLDETMAVYNKDVVLVPRGYHPVATIAGYNSYYLNVMAGPVRKWLFTWEKDHQWINSDKYSS